MRDLAREFTSETKSSRGYFDPAADGIFRRGGVKGRIYFYGQEVISVESEPLRVRQIGRIKRATPVFKPPRACPNTYFLLIDQIQTNQKINRFFVLSEGCRSRKWR